MFATLPQDMDPLNNYTTTRGVDPRSPWSPIAGSFLGGTESKYVCHIIYILVLRICCNMAVSSKSLFIYSDNFLA